MFRHINKVQYNTIQYIDIRNFFFLISYLYIYLKLKNESCQI